MIKLYDLIGKNDIRFSPYCWRIKYLLNFKQIPYETVPTTFTDRLKNPIFGESRLPTMEDNEMKISDSFIIAKYIESNYLNKNTILISSSNIDAVTFINNWSDNFLNSSILQRVLNDITYHLDPEDKDYFILSRTKRFGEEPKKYQDKHLVIKNNEFIKNCALLNTQLKDRLFILGDQISYADMIILGSFTWGDKVSKNTRIDNNLEYLLKWKEKIEVLCK
ncbi:MAG: glutathione S-transferase N-terminal domain-containing protein [Hyphomicrobiales bacterium]|nr:glutathione S-transferase N-terminal domain-containing protein [Hyphomicrobiales bacterium]|tara:strand:+ start:94 stop:756 length:663 start_codon:yes stop_codon:yes gene_type:complete